MLDQLVEAVLASARYKHVSRDLVYGIGSQELAKGRSLKEAIKATKNKLHQVAGAYLEGSGREQSLPYTTWLAELRSAAGQQNQEQLRQLCRRFMAYHASTRERLPFLEQFYTTLLADLPPIRSIIDIACGLHPLSIPWMPLANDVRYYACDIYQDMTDFLQEFMRLIPVQGYAEACDVIQCCPTQKADLAFVLKVIPCLEQVDKSAGLRLLDSLNADYLLVSFPVHSLSGRKKSMPVNYEAHFRALIAHKNWRIERFEFPTELVFRITR